jgi:hypothetical protein
LILTPLSFSMVEHPWYPSSHCYIPTERQQPCLQGSHAARLLGGDSVVGGNPQAYCWRGGNVR